MSVLFISRIIKANTKRSQASFEYMVVTGIVFALLLPAIYLFYSQSQSNSDLVSIERLAQMGNDIVSGAEYVYPFGAGSKTNLEFTMPLSVTNITVRGQGNPTGNEFVINLFVRNSNHSLVFFSKYPLFIGNCTSVMPFPSVFLTNPGIKTFQIISCGANVSIYPRQ